MSGPALLPDSCNGIVHRSQRRVSIRARIIVGVVLIIAFFGVGTFASRAGERAGQRQWTIVNFPEPMEVQGQFMMGPVMIVDDDEKMAQGQACTTFYRFDTTKGPQEAIVSFHCRPVLRTVVEETTFTTARSDSGCRRLIEDQIAGDAEAHGVPAK